MAAKDLDRLKEMTGELSELTQMLKSETSRQARWLIMQRMQELMLTIGKGLKGRTEPTREG